jgi:hypothetical protein
MPYTPEQIKSRYNKLPADIREAIDSISTTNTVVDIGQKHDLLYDQISELVDEVGLTMIGLTPEDRFVTNIARRMQVDTGKAMLIAQDINKQIFDKIRESLKKIEGEEEGGYSKESGGAEQENNQFGKSTPAEQTGEETMLIDAEKAKKESVVSAVEKAGGFVVDKNDETPAPESNPKSLESKEDIMNVLELDSDISSEHLLSDIPETTAEDNASKESAKKQPDQSSIVDTLLSKGVAMPMGSGSSGENSDAGKQEKKVRPYDGTDPYREALE